MPKLKKHGQIKLIYIRKAGCIKLSAVEKEGWWSLLLARYD
ncbi:MAG: hypothetical protein ACI9DS_001549, partial [Glaciecola sp.]